MTFEKFLKIIDKSRKFHFNKIFLNGGEPTLHTKFDQISNYLSQYFPSKEKILGTNCTIISKSQPIFNTLLKTYDTVLIGCDDEHKNFEDVEKVVPVMKSKGKKVIINTIHGYISDKNKQKLKNFCLSNDVIQVYNKLHIFCIGKKKHLDSICVRYKNKSLLVNIDGDCFRCYTGIDETSPEFNIFDKDFIKKLFTERNYHYKYCAYCDEYLPNKSSYNKRR